MLVVVQLLSPQVSSAADDYKSSFQQGFQAIDRKRYNEAAGKMRDAIRQQPAEGGDTVKISGSFFSPYLPHYYLGVALYYLNDCAGALAEWRESERQGVIARTLEAGILKSLKAKCGSDPLVEKRIALAEGEMGRARRIDETLRGLVEGQEGRTSLGANSDFLQRKKQAEDSLAAAGVKLEESKAAQDPQGIHAARDLAAQAAQQLQGLADEATALISTWRTQQAELTAASKGHGPGLKPPHVVPPTALVPTSPPTAQPAPAPPASPAPHGPATAPGTDDLARLRAAANAFFSGEYAATLSALRHTFSDRRAASQAALFSAAARMAIYWLGGGREKGLLAQAREDVRRCKHLGGAARPPESAFSPRFIAFFDNPR
ncbi:MAG TPA: hypothetical protein VJA16_15245 [Thermoanaerobaculia bacterium]